MKIEIMGPGCSKCQTLAANARMAAEGLGLDYELVKVTDLREIIKRGVVLTPALAIDGVVKSSGQVLGETEITVLLTSAGA